MLGNVIAVIMGVIVGMALYIGIQIYGLFNVQKQESMAFLLCIVAPLLRSFCGCWIAAHLGPSRPMLLAMIVGIICLAGGIPMALMFGVLAVPVTMFELPLHPLAAWLAGFIEQKRRAAAEAPAPPPAETAKDESNEKQH